jgi:hypothetical protein
MQINLQFSEREYLRGKASEILFFFLFHKEKRKNQSINWKCPKNLLSLQSSMNRRDGYLFRVLQNSKITYRPHCPGTGGGAFFYVKHFKKNKQQ